MPRTSTVESPGCPPLRALTTDVIGLVKVVEARGKAGAPKVVETWGPPDTSRGILAASFADHDSQPLIAVARKNNLVEILNPLNGHALAATKLGESSCLGHSPEYDPIVGLHLLKTKRNELSSRLNVLLTCTEKGKASLRSLPMVDPSPDTIATDLQSTWDICTAGKVTSSSVTANEQYALFGGKGIELNVWDLDNRTKTWTSKPPPCNSLGIFSPTWFTAATFLNKEDHQKIAAGTNNHQIRLYDIYAQRRPVISVSFRETPIKAVAADPDGHTVYIGTGSGDLASFDMRTGKLLGCFVGKCCGSIRSIARHPELPILASCGLDRYLRIWDTNTRQLLSAVFLKQHLTNVVIDSHFSSEVLPEPTNNLQAVEHIESAAADDDYEDDDDLLFSAKSNKPKKKEKNKAKSKIKKSKKRVSEEDQITEDDHSPNLVMSTTKRKKFSSEGKPRNRNTKKNKGMEV